MDGYTHCFTFGMAVGIVRINSWYAQLVDLCNCRKVPEVYTIMRTDSIPEVNNIKTLLQQRYSLPHIKPLSKICWTNFDSCNCISSQSTSVVLTSQYKYAKVMQGYLCNCFHAAPHIFSHSFENVWRANLCRETNRCWWNEQALMTAVWRGLRPNECWKEI